MVLYNRFFRCIDFGKVCDGTRSAENEIDNAMGMGLEIVTPIDIRERLLLKIADGLNIKKIKEKLHFNRLDCLILLLLRVLCLLLVDYQFDLVISPNWKFQLEL